MLEQKYDSVFVGDVFPGAIDSEVLAYADKEKRILITNDKDFGELVYRQRRQHWGVILLHLNVDTTENRQKYIRYVLTNLAKKLPGSFVVVTEGKIRISSMDVARL